MARPHWYHFFPAAVASAMHVQHPPPVHREEHLDHHQRRQWYNDDHYRQQDQYHGGVSRTLNRNMDRNMNMNMDRNRPSQQQPESESSSSLSRTTAPHEIPPSIVVEHLGPLPTAGIPIHTSTARSVSSVDLKTWEQPEISSAVTATGTGTCTGTVTATAPANSENVDPNTLLLDNSDRLHTGSSINMKMSYNNNNNNNNSNSNNNGATHRRDRNRDHNDRRRDHRSRSPPRQLYDDYYECTTSTGTSTSTSTSTSTAGPGRHPGNDDRHTRTSYNPNLNRGHSDPNHDRSRGDARFRREEHPRPTTDHTTSLDTSHTPPTPPTYYTYGEDHDRYPTTNGDHDHDRHYSPPQSNSNHHHCPPNTHFNNKDSRPEHHHQHQHQHQHRDYRHPRHPYPAYPPAPHATNENGAADYDNNYDYQQRYGATSASTSADSHAPKDGAWETVPSRRDRRSSGGRGNTNHSYNEQQQQQQQQQPEEPPIIPDYIPPSSSNGDSTQHFAPFVLLLVGIPGSGKSTFAKALETAMPYKYVRINQDLLGSRQACQETAIQVLADGKCPVIDRCNFDPLQRKPFLQIAAHHKVPADAVVFTYPTEECLRRCQGRPNHETVQPHQARQVLQRMVHHFSPPLPGRINREKFRHLTNVVNTTQHNNAVLEYCTTNT